MITQDNITLSQRLTAPTPKFFKTVGKVLGIVAGVATVVVTAPVALPTIVTTVAGYVIAAASLAGVGAITLPVDFKKLAEQEK